MSTGSDLIAAERRRQIEVEGFTPEHDDEHGGRVLWEAAECYEAGTPAGVMVTVTVDGDIPRAAERLHWPWSMDAWKPGPAPRNLIRAGALYLAAAECFRRTRDDRPHTKYTVMPGETEADYVRWVLWLADICEAKAAGIARVLDEWLSFTRDQAGLTFAELSRANAERCARWHPGYPDDETWTGADWSNAVGGEAGELAEAALAVVAYAGKVQNTVKKIRRYETGTNTTVDKPLNDLLADLDAEMADVTCYLDLLATKYGRDLAGAIAAKFNAVSERQGFPERLPLAAADPTGSGEMVLLTERCTSRDCSGRVRYSELTDNLNTHWHVRPGASLVAAGAVTGVCSRKRTG